MEKQFKKLIDELNKNLHFLSLEQDNVFKRSEESLNLCCRAIEQCNKLIDQKNFKNKNEEIIFFKELKPVIASKLKFHRLVFKFEKAKPLSEKAKKIFCEKELALIDAYFLSNIEFITYYKHTVKFGQLFV